jgi:hypothetical protein
VANGPFPAVADRRVVPHILGQLHLPLAGRKTRPLLPVPARPDEAGPNPVDLSPVYNVALAEDWQPVRSMDDGPWNLGALPAALATLGGVRFDVRGLVQLRRLAADCELFPDRVSIAVGRAASRVHLLHGTRWKAEEDATVAILVVRFTDGSRLEFPLRYGRHFRQADGDEDPGECPEGRLGWKSPAPPGGSAHGNRIYVSTLPLGGWGRVVARLEYLSGLTRSAPFLVAVTLE